MRFKNKLSDTQATEDLKNYLRLHGERVLLEIFMINQILNGNKLTIRSEIISMVERVIGKLKDLPFELYALEDDHQENSEHQVENHQSQTEEEKSCSIFHQIKF